MRARAGCGLALAIGTLAAGAGAGPGCGGGGGGGTGGPVGKEPKGSLPPDHPPIAPREPARGIRRMSFAQFESSLPVITGGITWMEGARDVLPGLAASMGRPDYIYVTDENLEPNALFLKFVSDGSQKVCQDVARRDQGLPADQRVLARHAGANQRKGDSPAVQKNLEYLRLRFHNTRPANDPVLPGLRGVFDKIVSAGGSTDEAWTAVCVALFNHPDFLLY